MEAKETIISNEQVNAVLGYNGMKHGYQRKRNLDIARTQAKISSKAAIEELAEWICKHRYSPISGWHLVTSDIIAMKQGKIPG